MAGLNQGIIDQLDKEKAIGRVRTDLQSDFIFAPQYKLIFDVLADDLWDELLKQLKSGTYHPGSLITAEVPKPSGMTRPGSILYPLDRALYQAISDLLAPVLDSQLDGSRVFSYRLLDPDPTFLMFQSRGDSYRDFKAQSNQSAIGGKFTHATVADITSYFVHLNHHTLENLLTESNVPQGVNSILVKSMLENWSGRFSYGIPQGLFPSDLLGNYYLSALDTFLASRGIRSLRYVDDLVLLYESEHLARSSMAPICRFLRGIGLDFNESKSRVVTVQELVYEQTELDKMFESARQEIIDQMESTEWEPYYGFQDPWDEYGYKEMEEEDVELLALQQLWDQRDQVDHPKRDQLDIFCLGALGRSGSDIAIDMVLKELGNRPHLTRSYCHYVAPFVRVNTEIRKALCTFIERDECIYDWELQWPIAALLSANELSPSTINKCLGILADRQRNNELRALCALLAGKFGTGSARANLRAHWDSEDSDHVRTAMILGTMFLGPSERDVLLSHWGRQSTLFSVVAKGVRKQLSGSISTS